MVENIKISIITVAFNSQKTIGETIQSILSQTFKDYEHIIIDGDSFDNTLEEINKYVPQYKNKPLIVCEKDNGLYDAMNKGIALAKGEIIGILNSDDILADDGVLQCIVDRFNETNCDATYSDIVFKDENMQKVKRVWIAKKGSIISGWHPPHPTLYVKKSVYDKIGSFDTKYKVSADFDFMTRLMLDKTLKMLYINKTLIIMRLGGESTATLLSYARSLIEADKTLRKNEFKFPLIADFCRIIRVLLQFISR